MHVCRKEEARMQKTLAFLAALSFVAMLSGVALADGSGMCNYGSHVKQMASDQTQDSKTVATTQLPKTEVDKLLVAQTEKPNKPASTPQK